MIQKYLTTVQAFRFSSSLVTALTRLGDLPKNLDNNRVAERDWLDCWNSVSCRILMGYGRLLMLMVMDKLITENLLEESWEKWMSIEKALSERSEFSFFSFLVCTWCHDITCANLRKTFPWLIFDYSESSMKPPGGEELKGWGPIRKFKWQRHEWWSIQIFYVIFYGVNIKLSYSNCALSL